MTTERVPGNMTRSGKGTLIYALDGTLSCLAVNRRAELLAVAGRSLFQVLAIHDDCFVPVTRSKTAARHITPNAPDSVSIGPDAAAPVVSNLSSVHVSSATAHRSQNVTVVSWSCANTVLATGSTNGTITLWNVDHTLTQQRCFAGHSRSIHCVTFHPTNPWELVSASQDGRLKLFDTREPSPDSNARTFIQRTALPSPVRDVAYCPRHSFLFAAGLENGTISLWDTRQQGRPYWAFQGHSSCVATLDWHPIWQGAGHNWLATAGVADHLIKVWNFDQAVFGQSGCPPVVYTMHTSNISRIRWRPGSMTQLVSSCNQTFDLNTYLWDLRRPYLPYAAFEGHKGVVTSIAWNAGETDYFYTVGRDGLLIRHCVADGLRPAESAPPVALCFSPRGQLVHAVSRDRFLVNQPARYVDETNLVTQSPFFPSFRGTNGVLSARSSSSTGQNEGPPGFYAAPSCDKLDWYNSAPVNLPPMGSSESAELFVSQAQSLLFCFDPSLEAFRYAGGAVSNTILLSDLIVMFAKHYQFVGPSVDHVCSHNAAVALRFGQVFLVQFWSLLRCIYGSIPTTTARQPPVTHSEPEQLKASVNPTSEPAEPVSCVPVLPTDTVTSSCPSISLDTKPVDSIACSKPSVSSGILLRDMLSSIGVDVQLDDPSAPSVLSRTRTSSPIDLATHAVDNANTNQDMADVCHLDSQLELHPTESVGRPHCTLEPFKFPPPVVSSRPERLLDSNEPGSTASVSSTIPIDRRRFGSPCKSGRSPNSVHLFPHGLGLSASSAQTCDSLGEPVDFLFHFNNPTQTDEEVCPKMNYASQLDRTGPPAEKQKYAHDLDSDLFPLVQAFGPPDDPIFSESTFLPDEAFSIRHPIENHLQKVFDRSETNRESTNASNLVSHCPEQSAGADPVRRRGHAKSRTGKPRLRTIPATNGVRNDMRNDSIGPQGLLSFTSVCDSDQKLRLLAPFNAATVASAPIGQTLGDLPDATPLIVQWFHDLVEYGHVQTVCTALLVLGSERLRIREWISEVCIENWFMAYLDLLSRFRMWTLCARIMKQCGSFVGGVDAQSSGRWETRRPMIVRDRIRSSTRKTAADTDAIKTTSPSDSGRLDTVEPRTRFKSGGGPLTTSSTSHVALAPGVSAVNQASTTLTVHCGRCSKPFVGHEATQRATGHTGWACTRHTDMANAVCALCHLTVKGLFVWCRGCSHGGHLEHIQEWFKKRLECPAGCGHRCQYG